MKIKLLLTFLLCLVAYSNTYASFPVERVVVENSTESLSTTNTNETTTYISPAANTAAKDLTVGIILWFFLGWAAGHRWYYEKPVLYNILFIVTLGGLGVWWVIDLVNMINGNF